MADIQDAIVDAKGNLPNITPVPPGFHSQANVHELKSRLQWGEPGLTIIDVRDHDTYNQCRISGAMNMPNNQIPGMVSDSLRPDRDIYVYGANAEETTAAANALRQAGFQKVAELQGGLLAWREIEGNVEGVDAFEEPGADAYNVFSRLQSFNEEKAKEGKMK